MGELSEQMKDNLTKVCICKGISRAAIKKAIADGADTLEKVQKSTGAGTGGCKGRRCTLKIKELLEETKR